MPKLRPPYPIPTAGLQDDAVTEPKIKDDEIVDADINSAAAIASSKLAAGAIILPVPYNAKIADITHADTDKHFLDLEAALTETRKIIAIAHGWQRIGGTGIVYTYANEGTKAQRDAGVSGEYHRRTIIADGTQRLQYAQSVAGDDWDVYCFGYVVAV